MFDVDALHAYASSQIGDAEKRFHAFRRVLRPGEYNPDGSLRSAEQQRRANWERQMEERLGQHQNGQPQQQTSLEQPVPSPHPMDFTSDWRTHPLYGDALPKNPKMGEMASKASEFEAEMQRRAQQYQRPQPTTTGPRPNTMDIG